MAVSLRWFVKRGVRPPPRLARGSINFVSIIMDCSVWTIHEACRRLLATWRLLTALTLPGVFAGSLVAEPVITEFMADNEATLADEDADFEDWVEIHNPDAEAVALSGWFLTDKSDNLTKWEFPAVTIPAHGYLVVFASGKDRSNPAANLHTNFSLSKNGDYLGLVRPDGQAVVSQFHPEFPPQVADVSYGLAADADGVAGYLAEPTPGAANGGVQDIVLGQHVSFSTGSTTFVDSLELSMTGADEGQVIRYTVSPPSADGGEAPDPTADSSLYTEPLTVTESSVIRAAVFSADGGSRGVVTTIQLLEMDANGGTGARSFATTMPIVVIDNHGFGPMSNDSGRRLGWLYTYEPGEAGLVTLAAGPSAASLVDFAVRGQSSSLYPKKGFKFDMLNDWGEKRPFDLLGLGAFDEWNIVAPYLWDTAYIRNAYAYGVSNAIGRWAARTRLAEAFVNHGPDGLTLDDYHGVVVVTDKTDVENGRIELADLEAADNEGEAVTGGYLLLVDQPDPDKYHWTTEHGFPDTFNSVLQVDTPKIDDITEPQKSYIVDFVQRMEDALYSDADDGWHHRTHLEYIDRSSWVDHHLLNVLFKNPDAFWRSSYFQKDRAKRLVAGPIWDFDRAFDSADPRVEQWDTWNPKPNTTQGTAIDYWGIGWWGVLASDPDFMQAWIDRWQNLRVGEALSNDAFVKRMNYYRRMLPAEAAARDLAKWPENASRYGSFAGELDHMQWWLTNRADWIDQQFLARPSVTANDDGSMTVAPPAGASLVYTHEGADPRLRGGLMAPDAVVSTVAVTFPPGSLYAARAYDASRDTFPGSKWSGLVPGPPGGPYAPHPRLTNVSSRTVLTTGGTVVIGGFVVEDTGGKTLLVRGVGPALTRHGIENALPDPSIEIYDEGGNLIASNQGWESSPVADRLPDVAAKLGAFPFDAGSADAATLVTLPAGHYTVHLRSVGGQAGTALLEVYEEDDIGSLLNLSVRGAAEGSINPLIAGFVVDRAESKRLLIRGVGPGLAKHDVSGVLENPRLVLRLGDEVIATSDDWSDAPNQAAIIEAAELVGAFALEDGSRDAVILVTVSEPGVYTASVTGEDGGSGVALVEVYEIR